MESHCYQPLLHINNIRQSAKIIEISGGTVAGFIFVINLFDLPGNNLLKKKSYFTESLIEFPGH